MQNPGQRFAAQELIKKIIINYVAELRLIKTLVILNKYFFRILKGIPVGGILKIGEKAKFANLRHIAIESALFVTKQNWIC